MTVMNAALMSAPRARRRAFTLVEILATLALVAIVLPTVMAGLSLSLSAAEHARRHAEAAALGHSKLMELLAAGQWYQAAFAGDFGAAQPDYRWTAQLSDWDGKVLQQVDLTVWWRQGRAERNVTLSTLVYAGVQQ